MSESDNCTGRKLVCMCGLFLLLIVIQFYVTLFNTILVTEYWKWRSNKHYK